MFFEGGEVVRKNWPKALFLPDDEYGRVLEAFPRPCSDIIAIDPISKKFLLAKRKHQATIGVWCFGGGQRMGETPREAAVRNLKRETSIELSPDEFQFLWLSVNFFKYRNPEPQARGEHNVIFTFVFAPTPEEVEVISRSLDPEEYEKEHGLHAYTLAEIELLTESQKTKLVEYWHAIFG